MKPAAFVAIALLAAAPALAQSQAGNEELGDPTRKICRVQNETGSRLKRTKLCLTAAEWSAAKFASRGAVERAQQSKPTQPMEGIATLTGRPY